MQTLELIRLFLGPFEAAEFPYMVTGSVATILFGEPRLTNDVDLVVSIRKEQAETFAKLFSLPGIYCPPAEVIAVEVSRASHAHFNLLHSASGFKADIYPVTEYFQRWGLEKRKRVRIAPDFEIWVAPLEYVIVMKLQYFVEGGSQKHLTDIRGLLNLPGNVIDRDLIREHAGYLNLDQIWKSLES